MNCIVLAGGRGIRLSPLTDDMPKPLIQFKDKSLIDYLIEMLYDEFEKIIIIVDYLAFKVQDHFSNSKFADKLIFVQQNPNIRGTMGALLSAKQYITQNFLVICSDNLYDQSDIKNLLQRPNSFLIKRVTTETKQEHYKNAKYSLVKNSDWNYLEAGAWYLEKEFINIEPILVSGSEEFGIPQTIFADYQKDNSKYKIVFADYWFPVGTHWELEYANANLNPPSND